MKIIEVKGDLFDTEKYCHDEEVVFAHCIASDFGLGGGIALEFVRLFNMRAKLNSWAKLNNIPTGFDCYYGTHRPSLLGKAVKIDNTYNLITKLLTVQQPEYDTLEKSLRDLKHQMVANKEKVLAIPDMIGCGIDGLERDKVMSILASVFLFTEIRIFVVKLDK